MEADAILASSEWVSAGGIALVLIGLMFIIIEVFLPAFGLFGFAGVAAILIGLVQLHQTGYIEEMPVSIGTIIFTAITFLVLAAAGGVYTFHLYRKKMTTGIEGMVGDIAKVLTWKGREGRIFVQGENWQAYTDEDFKLKKDDEVFVSKVNNMKAKIIPCTPDNTEAPFDAKIRKSKGNKK